MVWVSRKAESSAPCRAYTGRRRRQRQRCHPLKLRRVRLRHQLPDVYSLDEQAASLLAAQQGDSHRLCLQGFRAGVWAVRYDAVVYLSVISNPVNRLDASLAPPLGVMRACTGAACPSICFDFIAAVNPSQFTLQWRHHA